MVRRALLIGLVLVTSCKKYVEPKKLDEECKVDADCEQPLVCHEGLRATPVCLKTCGANAFGADQSDPGGPADTSCPPGWECAATLQQRLVDKHTGADQGSAFGGMMDQPVCVPKGWRKAPK